MNPDALSDLVLLLVCAAILWFHLRQRPAVAVAAGLIGLAACLGVLRYSGWAEMLGPHRFTSLLAACAAFPLLASGLRWPDAPLATRGAAVGRFVLVVGGVGIVLTLAGLVGAGLATQWHLLAVACLSGVVNAVTPAAVETDIFKQMTQQHIDFMLSKIPMARFGTVDEVAALVCWLCSEEASFSTGAVFEK